MGQCIFRVSLRGRKKKLTNTESDGCLIVRRDCFFEELKPDRLTRKCGCT